MGNVKGVALSLLLAFSVLHLPFAESAWFFNYHIHVKNDLPLLNSPPNRPNLFLHCKSKNKDLGERPMVKGQDYTWDTKINFFRTTLFFCNARWVGHKTRSFDAFEAKRDEDVCFEFHNSCLWSVRENGIYFSKNNATWLNIYPCVRLSNELGAGHPKSAAFTVIVVTLVSLSIAVIEAVAVLALRRVISYAFTEGETVAEAVSELCPFLAVTIVLNGVQPVLPGVAGCGWQTFIAHVNVGCYHVVGFKYNLGAKGIWSGMIGGTLMQTLILLWATFTTDWNKEVETTKKRLDKWVDKEPLLKN